MPILGRQTKRVRHRATIKRRNTALVASAERAQDSKGSLLRLNQPWQYRALRIYDTQGECANPAQYQARAMERIRYYPAVLNDNGIPEESSDPELRALFNRIKTPNGAPGDLAELAGSYARLQFVIGDGLLTVSEQFGEEVWEYLSPLELRLNPEQDGRPQEYRRIRAPGIMPEQLVEAPDNAFEATGIDQARVWRLWRRDISYSQWAFSTVKPVIEDYETLARLKLAVAAEASSRAAQRGLLYVPDELSFGPADPTQEENPDEDPLIAELQQAMARAIQNPGSAEAMAPFVMRGPGVLQTSGGSVPMADLIRHIMLGPNDRYNEIDAIEQTLGLIAGSIDIPKELMTGVGDVNHWTVFFLGAEGFASHTGPTLIRFCSDIGAAYLRPAAIEAGITDADRVTVGYDAARAVLHPDESGTALKAHSQLIVSDAYAREKIGAPETAAPPPAELKRRTEVLLKQDPYGDGADPRSGQGETPPSQGGTGADAKQAPPNEPAQRTRDQTPPAPAPNLAAMIQGAAMMQIDRARELAGRRLANRAQSCGDCQDTIKAVPLPLIAAALGAEQVRSVIAGHATEADLFEGIAEAFAERVRRWNVNGGWPEQLGQMVEQHAQRTLYEREVPAMPPGFVAACRMATVGGDG
jgi:hypothetical protein